MRGLEAVACPKYSIANAFHSSYLSRIWLLFRCHFLQLSLFRPPPLTSGLSSSHTRRCRGPQCSTTLTPESRPMAIIPIKNPLLRTDTSAAGRRRTPSLRGTLHDIYILYVYIYQQPIFILYIYTSTAHISIAHLEVLNPLLAKYVEYIYDIYIIYMYVYIYIYKQHTSELLEGTKSTQLCWCYTRIIIILHSCNIFIIFLSCNIANFF
jgi:hypothetical protein